VEEFNTMSQEGNNSSKQKMNKKKNKLHRSPNCVCSDMADHAYMHGLAGIKREKNIYKRLFWIFVFLAAIGKTRYKGREYYVYWSDFDGLYFCSEFAVYVGNHCSWA
jgi:hypothetical protein